jgi:hypothetical protein
MKIEILSIFSLIILIMGLIYFLISMFYFDKSILIISLTQMMCGSCGFYLCLKNTQKVPLNLKRKKN